VTDPAALEALRPDWLRLWAEVRDATPFQSPHWLLPWWRHVGRGRLATIAIRSSGGELVGIAPLYVHDNAATGLRHLFPLGIATTDYLDVLVRPGCEQAVLGAVAAELMASADWDVFEFPQLREGSQLLFIEVPEFAHEITPGEPHPVLPLDTAARIPKPMQDNVRYCRRRAERTGHLTYETADATQVPLFLDALARLHARRWSERGESGVLDAAVLAAHAEATPRLHAAGLLRLHALRLDGEFIAVLYCLMDLPERPSRRCYYYLGGFDPRRAELSPGTLLVAHAIDCAHAEGAVAFDFLRGRESYKYRWGAVDQAMFTLRLKRG
jgi:CelD/BcsL family acetyltransferase involved in cellulose biosynthesis